MLFGVCNPFDSSLLIVDAKPYSNLVVGAGFSGAVFARQLADLAGIGSLVIDSRDHLGGNCHTEREDATEVMVHRYGPHIFHTSNERVWDYVQRFGEWVPFINRVKASIPRGVFGLPINLHTINQFFGKRFNPDEARAFVAGLGDSSIRDPQTFEEQALRFLGRDLYGAFFKGYTIKQWGCEPSELPASILKRLPVRFNYDDSYYNSRWQAMPRDGYTEVIRRILDHPLIEVKLSAVWEPAMRNEFDHVVFTGPIDEFYGYTEGRLGYRTVYWDREEHTGDFQGNAVINYPHLDDRHTRVHEHKHFAPWETHEKSAVFTEYSKETEEGDIPYYPKRMTADKEVLERYFQRARQDVGVSFLGRLATYRYLDMHQVIGEALDFADDLLKARAEELPVPVLPVNLP